MSLIRHTVLCVVVFISFQTSVTALGVVGSLRVTKDVILAMVKAWALVDQNVQFTDYGEPILQKQTKELFKIFEKVDLKMEDVSVRNDNIGTLNKHIMAVINDHADRDRIEYWLNHLLEYLTQIDANYQKIRYYSKQKQSKRTTLEDFSQSVTSPDASSVVNLLEQISAFVLPQFTGLCENDIFGKLAIAMQEAEMSCRTEYSPQQVLYKLYDIVTLTELKGYVMVQFSYAFLRLYGKGIFTTEVANTRKKYEERADNAVKAIKNLLQNVSRHLWKCDPNEHKKGETYEELTNLIQGYIQNQQTLDKKGQCFDSCPAYNYVQYTSRPWSAAGMCYGDVMNCKNLESDITVGMTLQPTINHRRYQYIQFKNGKLWGTKEKKNLSNTTKFSDWSYYLFWRCTYCFCLCDAEGSISDRYFNMKPVFSDLKNNKVVTGLRFVKNNRIVHLQIQEGEMLARLKINSTTLKWKPVDNYTMIDRKAYRGQEFHTLSWAKRQLDLDDLEADDGYVVTGVRFKEIGPRLNFEIYTTKFDFESGKLQTESSTWIDNANTDPSDNQRTELRLARPDVPTRSVLPSIPTSRPNQYIAFTHSDIDRDVAQTTVPFLDAQKVESLEPVPLAGAGLFHKGRPSYGGFVAPKIITYDVSKHLKPVFSSDRGRQ